MEVLPKGSTHCRRNADVVFKPSQSEGDHLFNEVWENDRPTLGLHQSRVAVEVRALRPIVDDEASNATISNDHVCPGPQEAIRKIVATSRPNYSREFVRGTNVHVPVGRPAHLERREGSQRHVLPKAVGAEDLFENVNHAGRCI